MSDRARRAVAAKAELGEPCQCPDCQLEDALAWAAQSRSYARPKARHEFDVVKFIRELDSRSS